MRRIKALLALAVVLAVGASGSVATPASAASGDDVATIVSRLQDYYLGQGDEIIIANGIYLARTSEAQDYAASQNEDGSWSDVDYADRTSSANGATWSAYIALYRMLAMTQAYRDPAADGFGDPALVTAVERALLHWDRVDPGNQNWWETEIGESIAMGRISMFLGDELGDDAFQVSLRHNTGTLDPVGANGAWRTSNYIFEALATGDPERIAEGFDTIIDTIAVDDSGAVNEAVQPDASFWAHGAQLYSEGYGLVLLTYAALWADVARGTDLAFTRGQLDSIAFFAVDGTRWLIRGEIGMLYLNYRPPKTVQGVTSHASEFIEPLQRMVRTDPLYATAYQDLLDGITGDTRTNGVTGDKYFWRSEFSSHIRDDYGIFTRLNSSRTFGAELRTAYDEELGNPVYWNAMGSTAIQVNNREYLDLGPAFDWYHYPGVTAPYAKRTERGVDNRTRNGDGAGFTGGVSDGRYGVSVLTLDSAGTVAQKSYFTFDEEMVALGAGIGSTGDAEVHTTVNQAAAKPNATVDGRAVASGTAARSVGDARWAYNDEVGYVFASGQDVRVSNTTQTGSWEGQDPVSSDAFTLYVDHGVRPEEGTYDYTVLPAATSEEVEAYAADPAVQTLRNDVEVQAVRHGDLGVTMATFYTAGSVDLGDGRTLSVDEPAIVLLDESGETPVVSVANPDRPGLRVTVTLSGGGEDRHGSLLLGSGADRGRTVTAELVAGEVPAGSRYSASSTAPGRSAAFLGDGDRDTIWEPDGDGLEWVAAELERGSWVTKVAIEWDGSAPGELIVQTSLDGEAWTDHAHVSGAAEATTEVAIEPTQASYARVVLLDGDGGTSGIRELDVDASVNLAADRGTRASGYTGYNLVYGIADGDQTTRWSGNNADSAWAQVDLGSVQPVATVRLRWEAAFAKKYRIQLSDDGTTWRDAYLTPDAGSDGGVDTIVLEGESARFVRMQTIQRALDYGPSLWEFEVFADTAVADAPAGQSGRVNLALDRPATADSVHNDNATIVASKATDGSLSTKWSSARQNTEHWLQVDLGEVRSVSQAVVHWETGTSNDYRLEGSEDGTTWVELARVQTAQPTLEHVHDFATAEVRYVRVTGLPATQYGLNIWELELYGGYTFGCVDPVSAGRDGTAVAAATISPLDESDAFSAHSMDESIAKVTGAPRVGDDGRIEIDLATGEPGSTRVLVTHENGDEVAWCDVTVAADTAELEGLVDRANGLDSAGYTPASWAPLLTALEEAKSVLRSAAPAQAEVDTAATALASALDGLVERDGEPAVTVPSAPHGVTASSSAGTVQVQWSAPGDDGGAPVTGYEVTVGDSVVRVDGGTLSARVDGFASGTYAVTVRAQNETGWSEPSESVSVDVDAETPAEPVVTVGGSLKAGGAIVVTGTGFRAGTEYAVELRSTPRGLGAVTADDDGGFRLDAVIPADIAPGEHTVAVLDDGADVASVRVVIAAADPAPGETPGNAAADGGSGGDLAGTGGELAWLPWTLGTAVLLLLAGLALTARRRARRRTDPA